MANLEDVAVQSHKHLRFMSSDHMDLAAAFPDEWILRILSEIPESLSHWNCTACNHVSL